ncbi:cellulose synthase/poly-beta-1,6-N-acetylglucosamine synthase-like glycosyltransferase [Conyzicola lurida]|uniref:Cellulose synthase/poly-beta-1,6-N-acetylglucosamine synthase-like glycosyltransferase n=1 Tax=Conyzicola lurida TaxID=1172621 RepID=A0A841AME8_9MICO|nr:glycosyltransferase [Conyzicola lurida]MBB5842886.1 cellulose synthase/poly-beta-1,6-N-acetylglucosamine synthase-like glycosyltransferase [Conyzicola lurida]
MRTAIALFVDSQTITDWRSVLDFLGSVAPYFPLAIAGSIVWLLWLYRVILSATAKPIESDFRSSTSVIVPSYHEDPDILMRCLESWREQNPTEIIIVLDVMDVEAYDRIVALGDDRVVPVLYHHVGKRSALGVGVRRATSEILVFADSDTSWLPNLLENVQKPFADPLVGGVSTQQNVYQRTTSIWRRVADWLVNLRYYNYVPAMGRAGAVPCLSGRTAAYRRSAVLPVLDNLENEFFLGKRCISGDDGRLTWLVLASGFKTVHQSSAKALSMFPSSFSAFVKQRVRWSRNSYRCYLTAIAKGWLWKTPFVTKVTVLQILLTPLTMGLTIAYIVMSRLDFTVIGITATAVWLLLTRGIRGFSHLKRHPQEIFLLPVVALVVILIALPIKLYAFVTMNKQGWLTRHADTVGGDGQTARTLVADDPAQNNQFANDTTDSVAA